MTALLPRARRTSRVLALGGVAAGALLSRRPPGSRAQQAVVLGALALGMPHGASDTELLRSAARGSRTRHGVLVTGYAAVAAGATVLVRRGGGTVERGILVGSAAHFAEGELACYGTRGPKALRLLTSAVTTVALPAAIGLANRRPAEVGVNAVLEAPRAAGERPGLDLLRDPAHRRVVGPLAALAAAGTLALALRGDREAALDSALLTGLDLVAPPSVAFATYFGGWHALRHTARVVDALVADGALPVQRSLPAAVLTLGRRSAWAAGVGLVAAAALAAADREHASDNAFAAVLGLTVPHMTTVAAELARRGR